jgi:uncharacterized protein DUF11/putative Ig domain-containing protein
MENPERRFAPEPGDAPPRGRTVGLRALLRRAAVVAVASGCLVLSAGQLGDIVGAPPAGATTAAGLGLHISSFAGDATTTPTESIQAAADVTYQVTVSNGTAANQTDVSVPVTTAPNFTLQSASVAASSGTTTDAGGVLTWTVASLAAASSATLTYTETADAPSAIESVATAASAASDQSVSPVIETTSLDVLPAADLSIGITDGVDSVAPEATDTYTITLTNNGPSETPDAMLTDTFNGAFAALGEVDSAGASFADLGGGQFQWTDIDLVAGAAATFQLSGTVPSTLSAGDAFVSLASVTPYPGEIDTDPVASQADSDTVSASAPVGPLVLALTSFDGDAATSSPSESVLAGADVTDQVTVTNATPSEQTDVSVPVTLPPSFLLHSNVSASAGTTSAAGGIVNWSIASLGAGASATLTLSETTDSAAAMESDTTAASATSDQSTEATDAAASVTVIPAADLAIAVSDGTDTVFPGAPDTTTITLTNNGPSAVSGATVSQTESGGFAALFAVSSVTGTSFTDLGTNQFEWSNIALVSGASATFSIMGTLSPSLTAGSAFTTLATGSPAPNQVDLDASTNAVDSDEVLAAPQAITFTAPALGVVGQSTTLSATGGASGNPVVFSVDSSGGSGVCTVSGPNGATLTYDAPGTCVVDADQAGNASDAAAPTVTASILVEQPPTFTTDAPPTTATVGTPYVYGFAAGGVPTPTFALAQGAPSWLTIDGASGAVRGTPPSGTTSFSYSVVATNPLASANAGPFTVTVSSPTPPRHPFEADVSAALSCPATVPLRTIAACTLTVANGGPATARRVRADIVLPFRFEQVSVTPAGFRFGGARLWFVRSLAPGSSATFSVHFEVLAPGRGFVGAGALAATRDPNYANNFATASISSTG